MVLFLSADELDRIVQSNKFVESGHLEEDEVQRIRDQFILRNDV